MSHVFLSYAASDRKRIEPLVRVLQAHGLAVWWDHAIPPGRTWHDVVEEALNDAKCVVVVWTRDSVKSDWVCAEAEEGRRRRILVPVLFDDVKIPLEFRRIQAAKLVNWTPGEAHPEFDKLKAAVERLMPIVSAPAAAGSGSLPADASSPRPSADATARKRRLALAATIAVATLAGAAGSWRYLRAARPADPPLVPATAAAPATPPPSGGGPTSAATTSEGPSGTATDLQPSSAPRSPETIEETPTSDSPTAGDETPDSSGSNATSAPRAEVNAEALQLVRTIIDLAKVNGGADQEAAIVHALRRINEIRGVARSSPSQGDRTQARQLNDEALAHRRAGRLKEARRLFERAYAADPTDIEVRNNLGYVLMKSGDLARAEEELLGVLSMRADRVSAWANLGSTYALMNRPEEAIAALANAYRFSGSPARTRSFLRQLAAEDDDARVRAAASDTLSLSLIVQSTPGVRTGPEAFNTQKAPASAVAPVDIPASHRHGIGSCSGSLSLSGDVLRYQTDRMDDDFEAPLSSVEQFETDSAKRTLRLKLRSGRTYNFTAAPGTREGFSRLQQAVAAARATR